MKYLHFLFLTLPLMAQEPAKPEEKKPEEAKQEAAEKKAESPSPVKESWVTGSVEFGYRFTGDVAGNNPVYRSIVDLGEGPKLFNVDLSIENASKKFFDRMNLFANGWGGDPYNTTRVDIGKERLWRLTADYRNIAYYNFLPSFANPGTGQGTLLVSERAFDTRRRATNIHLELLPGRRIVPYVAYERNTGSGSGITPFVSQSNEYPVPTQLDDRTWDFRGGVRFEFNRWHLTLEQGRTDFQDSQRIYETQRNPGNRTTPLLGQNLFLGSLNQQYSVTGTGMYSRVLATGSPFSWLNLYGMFLYSQPKIDPRYTQDNQGLFVILAASTFFTGQRSTVSGYAKEPHTSGSFSLELFPRKRFRVTESLTTDRFHVSSSALLAEQLLLQGTSALGNAVQTFSADRLIYNYNRQQAQAEFDLTKRITLRGGYQFVWGDAETTAVPFAQAGPVEKAELRRHVGLAGASVRPWQKLSLNLDYEASAGDRTFFRTSLQDYHRAKIRARYQVKPSLSLSANFSVLNNQNPTPGINYDFESRQNSLALQWLPAGGKRIGVLAEYTRYTVSSDINYLVPNDFSLARSLYRDKGHLATAILDVPLPGSGVVKPKLSFGGSMFASGGTRPTNYYQPMGRFVIPMTRIVQWFGEWRYYGYTETLYLYEGFRTHHFMTGLRLTM